MAKYSSLIKFLGKIDSFVFVGGSSKHVRSWDSKRSKQMKTDDRFKNVRLVQSDFGLASTIGKKIRIALQSLARNYQDATFSGRLTGVIFGIINKDNRPKGERVCDFKQFGTMLRSFDLSSTTPQLNAHLSMNHEIVNGGIRFSQFDLLKKRGKGFPLLDFVCVFVPEQMSAQQLGKVSAQFDSFTIEEERTVLVSVPTGMVGLVFVGLYFEENATRFYSGMKLLEVLY